LAAVKASKKCFFGRGSAPNSLGYLTALPRPLSWISEGERTREVKGEEKRARNGEMEGKNRRGKEWEEIA